MLSKTYYTVIIIICGISFHPKINLYNTKSVFTNLCKYYLRSTAHNLLSYEVFFTLSDAHTFSVII